MCTIFRENTAFGYKKWNCILLENGTHLPTNVGEADKKKVRALSYWGHPSIVLLNFLQLVIKSQRNHRLEAASYHVR